MVVSASCDLILLACALCLLEHSRKIKPSHIMNYLLDVYKLNVPELNLHFEAKLVHIVLVIFLVLFLRVYVRVCCVI